MHIRPIHSLHWNKPPTIEKKIAGLPLIEPAQWIGNAIINRAIVLVCEAEIIKPTVLAADVIRILRKSIGKKSRITSLVIDNFTRSV